MGPCIIYWTWISLSLCPHRPTGKCPPYRFEAICQLLHPAVGANQVGCSCTWQISLSLETNTRPQKKFQHLTRAEEVVITRLRIGHVKATKSLILSWGSPTTCHHRGQTPTIDHMPLECGLLQENRDENYRTDSLNVNTLFETVPDICILEFLREVGFLYLFFIWITPYWCSLLTSINPRAG